MTSTRFVNMRATTLTWVVLVLNLLVCVGTARAELTRIKEVRVWESPEETRLVFDLSSAVRYRIFSLSNPNRVVIDFERTQLKTDPSYIIKKSGSIDNIRTALRAQSELRFVLDVAENVTPASFTLAPNKTYPDHRLVVDLKRQKSRRPSVVKQANKFANPKRDVIIALDAGHGGEDPGAIGRGGKKEKDIVLAIAKELNYLLEKEPGFKPFMVRTGDYYIGLRERTRKARKANADFFISIHADAFKNSRARGSSVFVLSKRGATSETARWLADKENDSDLVGGVSLDDKEDHLAMTLLDLSMTHKRSASVNLGSGILNRLKGISKLHKNHVEEAAFVVLKSPDIPSLLIETGFISNPGEAKKLATKSYQKKMARAIFQGVKRYFSSNPPQGTWLAWKKNPNATVISSANQPSRAKQVEQQLKTIAPTHQRTTTRKKTTPKKRTHLVRRGETLSGIAVKYRVSMSALKRTNRIRNNRILVGQKLTIPTS